MDGLNIDGVKFTGFANKTSNVQKTNNSEPLFKTNTVNDSGFYPGLSFSPEARMEAEMAKSPFINSLNELFGLN